MKKENKERLDLYLTSLLNISRSKAQKLIKDGCILVNNDIKSANYLVDVNDKIVVNSDLNYEIDVEPENIPLDIVYEDEYLLVINKKSGMYGISGISSDFRDIEAKISERDHRAILAHHLFVDSVVDYIARYYVELGGCDCLCFTAGVGENSPHVRRMIIDRLSALGIKINRQLNEEMRFGKEGLISASNSSVPVYVIPTDEEVMIARDTYSLINNK